MKILAIDLGKSKSVACEYEDRTGVHGFETIPTRREAVYGLLERVRPGRVVIEVGSVSGWVADVCRQIGVEVEVANPSHEAWRWRNVKRKTDRDDALKLARMSALNQLPTVHMPAPGVRAWRELIAYRHALVVRRTAIKNSIRAILTRQEIDWPKEQRGFTKAMLTRLTEMTSAGGGELWRAMLAAELDQYRAVVGSIDQIQAQLEEIASKDARVMLLRTIPGVGARLAETVAAVIDDPRRFRNGRQVGCYAGLTPRRRQSGSMDRHGRISCQGHALLRSLLVEVAWLGRRHNPWMERVYQRALKGSPTRKKIAIVAVARRLLVLCWAMLRDGTPWRRPESAALKLAA